MLYSANRLASNRIIKFGSGEICDQTGHKPLCPTPKKLPPVCSNIEVIT